MAALVNRLAAGQQREVLATRLAGVEERPKTGIAHQIIRVQVREAASPDCR